MVGKSKQTRRKIESINQNLVPNFVLVIQTKDSKRSDPLPFLVVTTPVKCSRHRNYMPHHQTFQLFPYTERIRRNVYFGCWNPTAQVLPISITVMNRKEIIVDIISALYILLFLYAALSKLTDYEKFRVQLGQSPLLTPWAAIIAWTVPVSEIILSALLMASRTRLFGLYGALVTMSLFSTYIISILHFSEFVPCSCGGILEKMNWQQHLGFNLIFVGLAVFAICVYRGQTKPETVSHILKVASLSAVGSAGVMWVLYIFSDRTLHQFNDFIRFFPVHALSPSKTAYVPFKSFYLAGQTSQKIYLANAHNPRQIFTLNRRLTDTSTVSLQIKTVPQAQVRIDSPYFFVFEGRYAKIRRGEITNWFTDKTLPDSIYYSLAVPTGPSSFVVRSTQTSTMQDVLGKVTEQTPHWKLADRLLQKQIDGIFCTDGMLHYSKYLSAIIYLYYYRNGYVLADTNLRLVARRSTIDTNKIAKIKVASFHDGTRTLASPPAIINKNSCIYNRFLLVHSTQKAKNERSSATKKPVIDVYDLIKGSYAFSFYIPGNFSSRLLSFGASEGFLFALFENEIASYQLNTQYFN